MNAINELITKLRAEMESMPEYVCEVCGEKWRGMPDAKCWECGQAELQAGDRRRKAVAELAAVDPRFRGITFDAYVCDKVHGDPAAMRAVIAWQPDVRGLYLFGKPGCGKSHLAFAKAQQLIHEGRSVFAAEWTRLLKRIKATFDAPGETEADIWRAIERADVVFVDDLMTGREKPTDWAVEQCWNLIHARYQSGKPLLVTANYSLPELAKRIGGVDGDRIVSRMAELCDRVRVEASDYRLKGRAE